MTPRKIKENLYWVGAIDWDRRIFDSLIPLPDGTSYNAYLIKGSEKTALLDSVDPNMTHILMENLIDVENIDYIISHHAEQDHSGAIPAVMEKYKNATVFTSPKGKDMLINLLSLPEEKIKTVQEGENLSLGDKTLKFIHIPWVHWPETMATYLEEDKILFTCDFLGSHLASSELYAGKDPKVFEAAKRYFAEIMMPFRTVIRKNLEKLEQYEINMIAPSHGLIYDEPHYIIESHREWLFGEPKNLVVLPYISMHGSTKKMVEYFVDALIARGVNVMQFNLVDTDIGKLAMALVDAATIVVGTPTVIALPHPATVYAAHLASILKPDLKFASVIGSYSWGGKTVETIAESISNLKVELLTPVLAKGVPRKEDFASLDRLAEEIAEKHRKNNYK